MLINWFTVGAQIINFLILVWLLKRFLYKPILWAMEERQHQIADLLHDTENTKAAAEQQRLMLAEKNDSFERERKARLKTLEGEIETRRKQMTKELRSEMEALRGRWRENLEQERKTVQINLSNLVQKELFALVGKMVGDLAEAALEEQMIDVFLRRLSQLPVGEKERMNLLLTDSTDLVCVRTSFDLPLRVREKIIHSLGKEFSRPEQVHFQQVPEMICGIELLVGGGKISWTVSEYAGMLESKIQSVLEQGKHGKI